MKPVFMDFDRTHSGFVSRNQFARVLTTVDLVPSSSELDALFMYYGKEDNPQMVSYHSFCRDVEHADSELLYKANKPAVDLSI